jgi:antitoxin VapB
MQSTPARAKLFPNGASQAVRLPRAFRFEGDEVLIRREGRAVILEPIEPSNANGWSPELMALIGTLDEQIERPPQRPIAEFKTRRMLPPKSRR